jgi:hypothetical protein
MSVEQDAARLADSQGLPRVTYAKTERLCETLEPGETISFLGPSRIRYSLLRKAATSKAQMFNEIMGGLLGVTDRRVLYRAETIVGKDQLQRGNEIISIPLSEIESVEHADGRGWGDIRKIASVTLHGGRLILRTQDEQYEFIEIKPVQRAAEMASAIRSLRG